MKSVIFFSMAVFVTTTSCFADNPIITNIYTADPTARVYNGKLFLYPSHDVPFSEELGVTNGETHGHVMTDYYAYSSENLFDWTDHGMVLAEKDIPWAMENAYALWAPDIAFKDGTYFYYFPAKPADKSGFRKIGVATAKNPEGPFKPQPNYMINSKSIDPNIFIDDDGQIYMYWGGGKGDSLSLAKMQDDMLEIVGKAEPIIGLPQDYKEGPFMFKRGDIYYLTFPLNVDGTEDISYATGPSATGPFTFRGKILERFSGWTSHHSIVEYRGEWYMFYHNNLLSGGIGNLRNSSADRIFFNPDGSIQPVQATLRGVGVCPAERQIQIDRYSAIENADIDFLEKPGIGTWKVEKIKDGGWVKYDQVDFAMKQYTGVKVRVSSQMKNAQIEVRWGKPTGLLISTIDVPHTKGKWQTIEADVKARATGIEDLVLVFKTPEDSQLEVDWLQFVSKKGE